MKRIPFLALAAMALTACSSGGKSPPSTYDISGTVSGATAAGVTISLTGATAKTTTTDASGNYTFGGLANGSYTVTPSMNGYSFSPASIAVTVNGANVSGQNFTASAAASTYSISGKVSGDTAVGVTVTLSGANTGSTITDAGGVYSFTGLVNGNYTVTPSKAGYSFAPTSIAVTVSGADVTGQDFTATAQPIYGISGVVSGAIAAGVTIYLADPANATTTTTTTDTGGNYAFTGLTNGSYTVIPSKTGYSFTPASKAVTVNGASVSGQNFTAAAAAATYSISGTVRGATNAGVTITLSGDNSGSTITDASGNYTFNGLVNGNYTLTPSKSGFSFTPTNRQVTVSGADLTGEDFTAAATTYSIYGKVSGDTAAGVTVTLSGDASSVAITDASGAYTFTGLSNGNYTLTPSKSGYSFTPTSLNVTVDGANVPGQDFTATANTHSISGKVSGATGIGVTIYLTGGATNTTVTDASGAYSFTGLANGSYTVTPSKMGYSFTPSSATVAVDGADLSGIDFTATAN